MPIRRWTIMEVIVWTAGYLKERGSESPRLDAELLLANTLSLGRVQLYLDHDKPLTADELARYKAAVKQRADGESVAHITGRRDFWKLEFLTPAPLFVPRPETELVVEKALAATSGAEVISLLDRCTGTGAILVSLLMELPSARGVGVDVSGQAIRTAAENGKRAEVSERAEWVEADAVDYLSATEKRFDTITCNPPYVASADWANLVPAITQFEPREAVDGGGDGLDFLRRLVPQLPGALRKDGTFVVEYSGDEQTADLTALLEGNGLAVEEIVKDLAGIQRLAVARLKDPS
mgnify:CR=1 FL=1